jgi:hypothetical protein
VPTTRYANAAGNRKSSATTTTIPASLEGHVNPTRALMMRERRQNLRNFEKRVKAVLEIVKREAFGVGVDM